MFRRAHFLLRGKIKSLMCDYHFFTVSTGTDSSVAGQEQYGQAANETDSEKGPGMDPALANQQANATLVTDPISRSDVGAHQQMQLRELDATATRRYVPLSAKTGMPFNGYVCDALTCAASRSGFSSPFWASEVTFRSLGVQLHGAPTGIDVGYGTGPLHLMNCCCIEDTDLHYFILANPIADSLPSSAPTEHLFFSSGRWQKVTHSGALLRLRNAAKAFPQAVPRWIDATVVRDRHMAALPHPIIVDAVGKQRVLLFNAEQTNDPLKIVQRFKGRVIPVSLIDTS